MRAKLHVYDTNRMNLFEKVPLATPYLLLVEPTFRCNIRCNYCIHSVPMKKLEERGIFSGDMSLDTVELITKQVAEFPQKLKQIVISGNGEPLLYKELPKMIKIFKESNITEKIMVVTNGLLLTPELGEKLVDAGVTIIRISLQGLSAKKYQDICGVNIDYDEFYNNLKYFYEHKRDAIFKIKIADTALVDGDTADNFYEMFGNICDHIDIEHIYNQFQGVDYDGNIQHIEGKTRYGFDYRPLHICSPAFFKLDVLWDGKITFVYPDGVTFDGFDIRNISLKDAWLSPEYTKFLIDMLKHDYSCRTPCVGCTRYSYGAVTPTDILDGHEEEILNRMPNVDNDTTLKPIEIRCNNDNT